MARRRAPRPRAPALVSLSVLLLALSPAPTTVEAARLKPSSSSGDSKEDRKQRARAAPTPQHKEQAPPPPAENFKFKLADLLDPYGEWGEDEGGREGGREGEYGRGGPAEGTFVMMESGKMMEDWEDLMRMEPPKPLREYMECLTVTPFGSPPPSSSFADQGSEGGGGGGEEPIYLVVDDAPTGCVTLNVDCLLHAVPELAAPASSSSSSFPSFSASQPFPRTATERFPFLLDPNQYACTPSSSSSSPITITCLGRAAPVLLEAAFTRLDVYHPSSPPSRWEHHQERDGYGGGGGMDESDSGIHTYSNAQLDMQDDFADLCAFYPSMRDGETCLDLLSGWLEYTQDYPLSSSAAAAATRKKKGGGGGEEKKEKKEKDKRRRRDQGWMEEVGGKEGEEEEVREAWSDDVLYWLYMEEIDFFSGKFFEEVDAAREDDARRMANGEPSYYEEMYGGREGGRAGREVLEGEEWQEEDEDDDDDWDWMYEGEGMEKEEWDDDDDDEDKDEDEDEGDSGGWSAGTCLTDINGNPEKVSSSPPPSSSSSQRKAVGRSSSSGKTDSSSSSSSSKSKSNSRDAIRPTVVSKGVVDAEGNIEKLDEYYYTDEVPENVTAMLGGGGNGQDMLDDHGGVALPQ